jgi:hypothetical protein
MQALTRTTSCQCLPIMKWRAHMQGEWNGQRLTVTGYRWGVSRSCCKRKTTKLLPTRSSQHTALFCVPPALCGLLVLAQLVDQHHKCSAVSAGRVYQSDSTTSRTKCLVQYNTGSGHSVSAAQQGSSTHHSCSMGRNWMTALQAWMLGLGL